MCIFIFYYKLPQDIIDVKPTFHMQGPNTKSKLVAWYPSVMEQRYRRVLISQNKTTIIVFAKFILFYYKPVALISRLPAARHFNHKFFSFDKSIARKMMRKIFRLLSLNLISMIPAESCLFLYSLFFYRFNVAKRMTLPSLLDSFLFLSSIVKWSLPLAILPLTFVFNSHF